MTNEEKLQSIVCFHCNQQYCNGLQTVKSCPKNKEVNNLIEMARWKDELLDSAIDKALQRNGDFLKQGKITQYGYDIAFVTIQNIREYLKQ